MRFQVAVPVRDAAMVHHSPGCCVLCSSCRAVGGVLRLLPLRLAPHWGRVRVRCSALPDCAPRGVRSRPRRGRAKCGGLLAGRVLRWGRGWAFGPRSLRCVRGPLSTRALTVGEHANGTCGVVHPAGLEPACPWATPFEGVVYPGSTTDACSPCLLVKGADCAGVILACLRGWWSRSCVPVLGTSLPGSQSPHRAIQLCPPR